MWSSSASIFYSFHLSVGTPNCPVVVIGLPIVNPFVAKPHLQGYYVQQTQDDPSHYLASSGGEHIGQDAVELDRQTFTP